MTVTIRENMRLVAGQGLAVNEDYGNIVVELSAPCSLNGTILIMKEGQMCWADPLEVFLGDIPNDNPVLMEAYVKVIDSLKEFQMIKRLSKE